MDGFDRVHDAYSEIDRRPPPTPARRGLEALALAGASAGTLLGMWLEGWPRAVHPLPWRAAAAFAAGVGAAALAGKIPEATAERWLTTLPLAAEGRRDRRLLILADVAAVGCIVVAMGMVAVGRPSDGLVATALASVAGAHALRAGGMSSAGRAAARIALVLGVVTAIVAAF